MSIGTFGCNMICSICQNYEIYQYVSKSEYIDIAFTCNEPFMWYEYIYGVSKNKRVW